MPRCAVVDTAFDWEGDFARRRAPCNERVIYEMHVGGFTRLHPDVPPQNYAAPTRASPRRR